jgi:hypothetical protein
MECEFKSQLLQYPSRRGANSFFAFESRQLMIVAASLSYATANSVAGAQGPLQGRCDETG